MFTLKQIIPAHQQFLEGLSKGRFELFHQIFPGFEDLQDVHLYLALNSCGTFLTIEKKREVFTETLLIHKFVSHLAVWID